MATPLPIRLVMARASAMKRSMPRMSDSPATGMTLTEASVAASVTNPPPATAAAPFDVSNSTPRIVNSSVQESVMLHACAMKIAAIVR